MTTLTSEFEIDLVLDFHTNKKGLQIACLFPETYTELGEMKEQVELLGFECLGVDKNGDIKYKKDNQRILIDTNV